MQKQIHYFLGFLITFSVLISGTGWGHACCTDTLWNLFETETSGCCTSAETEPDPCTCSEELCFVSYTPISIPETPVTITASWEFTPAVRTLSADLVPTLPEQPAADTSPPFHVPPRSYLSRLRVLII